MKLGKRIKYSQYPTIDVNLWDLIKEEATYQLIGEVSIIFVENRLRTEVGIL